MKHTLLLYTLLFTQLVAFTHVQAQTKKWASTLPQKPNVVFILTDDMGWSDLGCYGNPYNETPNIDKLAANGIKFNDAYAASPVCSPSRAAFLTGKHPARLKLTNYILGERTDAQSPLLPAPWKPYLETKEFTLAEMFQESGYVTAQIGKWHLGTYDTLMPYKQGFDYTRTVGKNGLDYYNYNIVEGNHKEVFADTGTVYLTDKLTEYCIEFIRQNKDKPFFLYLSYTAPHVLLVPRGDKLRKYLFKYNKFNDAFNPYYAAMIESVDDGVGLIMKELEKQQLLDNTLVVFTSDNGGVGLPELGPTPTSCEPLRKWKGHMYDGGIRVPAIFYWKNTLKPATVTGTYFSNTDYFPTFAELINSPHKKDKLDGKSIMPMLQKPTAPHQRGAIFWHYPHFSNQLGRPAAAIRLGEYKLVENYETGKLELYNLTVDIGEANDLATTMPDKVTQLKRLLDQWRAEVQANMPIKK